MKYLVSVEGAYGYPDSDYSWHNIVSQDMLRIAIKGGLEAYLDNNEVEDLEELIDSIIKSNGFYHELTGYGIFTEIKIEEV